MSPGAKSEEKRVKLVIVLYLWFLFFKVYGINPSGRVHTQSYKTTSDLLHPN